MRRDNDDNDDDDEDNKSVDESAARRQNGHRNRPSQSSYSGASPELKRMGPKHQGYLHQNPPAPKRQTTADSGKERNSSFVDCRDSAVFSDEAQSPTGMLS